MKGWQDFFLKSSVTSLEKYVAEVGTVNGPMAHGARLVLLRLVMRRPDRSLRGEGVALQAEQVDLADPQQPRIGGAMRGVAAGTALGLHRDMLVNEGPLLISMALVANEVPARKRPDLTHGACPVDAVAVAALDQPLLYAMMKWLGKVRLRRGVAAVTQLGLVLHQQALRLFGMVRGMAVQASHVIAVMR